MVDLQVQNGVCQEGELSILKPVAFHLAVYRCLTPDTEQLHRLKVEGSIDSIQCSFTPAIYESLSMIAHNVSNSSISERDALVSADVYFAGPLSDAAVPDLKAAEWLAGVKGGHPAPPRMPWTRTGHWHGQRRLRVPTSCAQQLRGPLPFEGNG